MEDFCTHLDGTKLIWHRRSSLPSSAHLRQLWSYCPPVLCLREDSNLPEGGPADVHNKRDRGEETGPLHTDDRAARGRGGRLLSPAGNARLSSVDRVAPETVPYTFSEPDQEQVHSPWSNATAEWEALLRQGQGRFGHTSGAFGLSE